MFGPSVSDASVHVLGGATKAALMYWIPVTLWKRRLHGNSRRAIAIGVYVGMVRLVDRLIRLHCRKPDHDVVDWEGKIRRAHMMIAGFIGAAIALLVDPSIYQSTLILFWSIVRALRVYIPNVPYGSTIVMCLSASQILSAWIRHPEDLDKGYFGFLLRQGMRKPCPTRPEPVRKVLALMHYPHPMTDPCDIVHPGKSHIRDLLEFWPDNFLRSVKLYLPVYLVMLLFSRRRNPVHFITNVAQSSAFLATYCTLAWGSSCLASSLFPGVEWNRGPLMMHTWMAGLGLLIERDARRPELAAYCATYAFDSIYRRFVKKPSGFLHWLILCICSSVMLHNHTHQPAMLMKWLFKLVPGPNGVI